MKKNTYSLLSGQWMFAGNSKDQMLPFLFSLVKNGSIGNDQGLAETSIYFQGSGEEHYSSEAPPQKVETIAVINIHHPIFKYDQECGPKGTQTIINMMEDWKHDESVIGVLLNFNSGGGQASGNSEFAEYVNEYKEVKPVVTFTKDVIGSAAYYMGSASSAIIAHPKADFIGCIGSMFYQVNLEGILEKEGATINELYADGSPDKNKQSRALKEGNPRPLIEKILNPSAEEFKADVKRYRPQVTELALKGDIFSPNEALEQGLIDELGTLQTAIDKVFSLAQSNKGNSNNNVKSKRTTMPDSKLPLIEGVLGQKFEEDETKDGIILTDDQAAKIETALSDNATAIADAKTAANQSTETINTLKADSTKVTTAIQNALKEAEVEGAEKMTNEQGIEALSALVKEYGAEDGASHTQTTAKTESKGAFKGAADNKLSEIVN